MARVRRPAPWGALAIALLGGMLMTGCSPRDASQGAAAASATSAPGMVSASGAMPPWLAPDPGCPVATVEAISESTRDMLDEKGSRVGSHPSCQMTCLLTTNVCGDVFFRQKVINITAGETCPEPPAPAEVCCAQWQEAKRTKQPCDPLLDADCDGATNVADGYPLDPSRP